MGEWGKKRRGKSIKGKKEKDRSTQKKSLGARVRE